MKHPKIKLVIGKRGDGILRIRLNIMGYELVIAFINWHKVKNHENN